MSIIPGDENGLAVPFLPGGGPGSPVPDIVRQRRTKLTQEYVASGASFNAASVPLALPRSVDDVDRESGDRYYAWMMTDPVVNASVRALKLAILAGGMDLKATVSAKPGAKEQSPDERKAQEVVDFCWRCVERCRGWNAFLMDLLGAAAYGNKMAEKVFEVAVGGEDDGRFVWKSIKVKPREAWQFVVDDTMNVLGIMYRSPGRGGERAFLPREKVVILTWDPADADPRGQSVLRPAVESHRNKLGVWPQLYKYLVQFGTPSLIGETAPGVSDAANIEPKDINGNKVEGIPLLTAQQDMSRNLGEYYQGGAVFTHPNGAKVYTIAPSGSGEAFHAAVDLFNREIVRAILLQTRATSEAEHGSKADSETGQDIFGLLVESGRQMLSGTLRDDCFHQLVALNYGQETADEFTPLVTFGTKEEDKAAQWSAVASLMGSGYLGESQMEELDSMLGLPIRDAIADAEKARQKAEAEANLTPIGVKPPSDEMDALDGESETEDNSKGE